MCSGLLTAERRFEDDSKDIANEDDHHGPGFMQ